ncbi:MAG TPA: hypothetical protein VEA41_04100 [Salinarimonas sp.]|jgi:hypothetical protein|nr:hypothetical protein [Salinarimonas sp.]
MAGLLRGNAARGPRFIAPEPTKKPPKPGFGGGEEWGLETAGPIGPAAII